MFIPPCAVRGSDVRRTVRTYRLRRSPTRMRNVERNAGGRGMCQCHVHVDVPIDRTCVGVWHAPIPTRGPRIALSAGLRAASTTHDTTVDTSHLARTLAVWRRTDRHRTHQCDQRKRERNHAAHTRHSSHRTRAAARTSSFARSREPPFAWHQLTQQSTVGSVSQLQHRYTTSSSTAGPSCPIDTPLRRRKHFGQ